MYSRETRALLRHYLEQGVGKAELARRFGVSRRTVYHWIETDQLVNFGRRDLVNLARRFTGSLLSVGSAAGIALMGQARGVYTFYGAPQVDVGHCTRLSRVDRRAPARQLAHVLSKPCCLRGIRQRCHCAPLR